MSMPRWSAPTLGAPRVGRYVPHTPEQTAAMLATLGKQSLEDLFAVVPAALRADAAPDLGPGLEEPQLASLLGQMARANRASDLACFAGGGYYDRYLPAAQRALMSRGEFLTAYTPYQPEVSQGTLQATFEFQSLVSELTGLPVATAGLYDGSTALAEAALMARAATGRSTVLVSPGVHPEWRAVLETYAAGQGVQVATLGEGQTPPETVACVIWQQPDFYGRVHDLASEIAARPSGALAVVAADPSTLGVLEAPGRLGADIVVAEGQGIGLPLSYGGPYLGLMAARGELLRRLPGRICGESRDARGRRAFVLTLQAREQHIRRARATSNVCTNQALCGLAVTIYLSLLGPTGLRRLGEICLARAHYLAARLARIPGLALAYPDAPFFSEFAVRVPDAPAHMRQLADRGFLVGPVVDARTVLVAVTERRERAELDGLAAAWEGVIAGGAV